MKFVFASYVTIDEFNEPGAWLYRIRAYAGIHRALGRRHEVVCVEQIDYEGLYVTEGVQYHFLRVPRSEKYRPGTLHRFIKAQRADVVIMHGLHYPLQLMQLRRALGRKVKIMVQHHAEKPFDGFKKYLQRWTDPAVDAYLFASREMGLDWVNNGNLQSPHKINEVMELSSVFYPMDRQQAQSRTGAAAQPVFLWVGRLNENKGPLTVVRAFLRFAASYPAARLYMLYHTTELLTEIRALLARNLYGDAVILVGQRPNAELLYWYNSADFVISGSHYEGSGTAICEAMSCGCIPVVTDIPSFRMITDKGQCGLLYEAGNEQGLLTVLMQAMQLNMEEKRQRCLAHFHSHLSFEAIAGRMQEIAVSLLK
jgi:glycosyltransferase involved in cell wall biosynthesis